ncbi:MAG TPA: hypothetical protein VEO95_03550, partial [Chthoniobacteraceae bacterium]|nr:hypothetical protein [Chthoniobacteraceae bacterium]
MSLPNPLPDNPHRWEGWRNYNSDDPYARLCLSYDSNPSPEQVEDNCRQLLIWWQKKLPLKSQPSNPLAQLLRGGMDEAPKFLAEGKTVLLDPDARARIDAQLHQRAVDSALGEFKKLLAFALSENELSEQDEERLRERGRSLGLGDGDVKAAIDAELAHRGALRVTAPVAAPVAPVVATQGPAAAAASVADAKSPFDEFRRLLQMSRLCLEGEEMTDDQRDAMCNMGESLGLTGGQAEDLIDEYLEQVSIMPFAPAGAAPARGVLAAASPARAAAVST